MNEKRIQEVMEIEKQAEAILLSAQKEAERLPLQAQAEAQELLKDTLAAARREAQEIVEKAELEDQAGAILSSTESKMRESEALAAKHLEKAVSYVLDQVIGKA